MSQAFHIKRGDTSPALLFDLTPESVVLTAARAVFSMTSMEGGAPVIARAPAVIASPTDPPTLRYDWAPGDTATPGAYWAEFEVTYADGAIESFPNTGHIAVVIEDDLG